MGHKPIDLAGLRFGRLTVIEISPRISPKTGKRHWSCRCRCDCGASAEIFSADLKSGNTASCGCLRREKSRARQTSHGRTRTIEYNAWCAMIGRCENPNNEAFDRYGGRGITVCDRWRRDFKNFYKDMNNRPSPIHSLERIDNDGNYEPTNCAWVTPDVQSRNRRPHPRNTSGVKGVYQRENGTWCAQIGSKNRFKKLGTFSSREAAIRARMAYAAFLGYPLKYEGEQDAYI